MDSGRRRGRAWALSHASLWRLLGGACTGHNHADEVRRQRLLAFDDHVHEALVSLSPPPVKGRDELQQLGEASISVALRVGLQEVNAVKPLLDGFTLGAVRAAASD